MTRAESILRYFHEEYGYESGGKSGPFKQKAKHLAIGAGIGGAGVLGAIGGLKAYGHHLHGLKTAAWTAAAEGGLPFGPRV